MARQERERRYIAEYMKAKYPGGNWILNVPLGPIPDYLVETHGYRKASAYYKPTRPRVDAVHWTDDTYTVIEAKVREAKAGIGDLTFYRSLVPQTLDLPYFNGQAFVYRLVIPWAIDWIIAAAHGQEIEVDIYWQDWIADYTRERQHYFTAEYREARAKKLEIRKMLGVE